MKISGQPDLVINNLREDQVTHKFWVKPDVIVHVTLDHNSMTEVETLSVNDLKETVSDLLNDGGEIAYFSTWFVSVISLGIEQAMS
jgi:hypothetical protein